MTIIYALKQRVEKIFQKPHKAKLIIKARVTDSTVTDELCSAVQGVWTRSETSEISPIATVVGHFQVPRQHQTELSTDSPVQQQQTDDGNKKTYCLNSIERIEEERRSLATDTKSHKSAILDSTKQLGATDNTRTLASLSWA